MRPPPLIGAGGFNPQSPSQAASLLYPPVKGGRGGCFPAPRARYRSAGLRVARQMRAIAGQTRARRNSSDPVLRRDRPLCLSGVATCGTAPRSRFRPKREEPCHYGRTRLTREGIHSPLEGRGRHTREKNHSPLEGESRKPSPWAKVDAVGGKMRFIATPNSTPHRIACGHSPLALRRSTRGG